MVTGKGRGFTFQALPLGAAEAQQAVADALMRAAGTAASAACQLALKSNGGKVASPLR